MRDKRKKSSGKEAARLFSRMTRILFRPDRVGLLDFEMRLPSAVECAIERTGNQHQD